MLYGLRESIDTEWKVSSGENIFTSKNNYFMYRCSVSNTLQYRKS